ncbi:hypothetical protein ABBQ38_004219 [Trebouxia sp. C0009 RCD-2024]
MQDYLKHAKQQIPMKYHGKCEWDFDSDNDDDVTAPITEEEKLDRTRMHCDTLCFKCWRKCDSGLDLTGKGNGPVLEVVRCYSRT